MYTLSRRLACLYFDVGTSSPPCLLGSVGHCARIACRAIRYSRSGWQCGGVERVIIRVDSGLEPRIDQSGQSTPQSRTRLQNHLHLPPLLSHLASACIHPYVHHKGVHRLYFSVAVIVAASPGPLTRSRPNQASLELSASALPSPSTPTHLTNHNGSNAL